MGKTCVICGKPSGMYPLCKLHLQMKNDGKVIKCEDCGTWHLTNAPCVCKKSVTYTELPTEGFETCVSCGAKTNGYAFCRKCFKKFSTEEMLDILNNQSNYDKRAKSFIVVDYDDIGEEENDEASIDSVDNETNDELTCIICGKPSNGKHFCRSCYYSFRNKSIILKISKCSEIEILESGYESKITCEDGHPVKSQQEAMIDNYLFYHDIKHIYEKPFPIDDNPKHNLHPDFYLPDLDIYIEHFGVTGSKSYEETKEYKIPLYEKAGITLICTTGKDINNLSAALEQKLAFHKKGKINFFE